MRHKVKTKWGRYGVQHRKWPDRVIWQFVCSLAGFEWSAEIERTQVFVSPDPGLDHPGQALRRKSYHGDLRMGQNRAELFVEMLHLKRKGMPHHSTYLVLLRIAWMSKRSRKWAVTSWVEKPCMASRWVNLFTNGQLTSLCVTPDFTFTIVTATDRSVTSIYLPLEDEGMQDEWKNRLALCWGPLAQFLYLDHGPN